MYDLWENKNSFHLKWCYRRNFLNKTINKLPFELHLPGHNFTWPGTKLDKRLNADGTPKEWSMPINRVDIAAYHHDLCNSKYSDTKTRNEVCDKTMLNELDGIMNPTLRGRIDKSIVGKLIKAKVHFWLRHSVKKNLTFSNELAEEHHNPVSKKFERRLVNVNLGCWFNWYAGHFQRWQGNKIIAYRNWCIL